MFTCLKFIFSKGVHSFTLSTVHAMSFIHMQTRKAGKSAYYDIHYWVGSMSTLDEQGAAAIYAIQMDEFLGSSPVQYREVQHHESSIFCGYFKQGIM